MTPIQARNCALGDQIGAWLRDEIHAASCEKFSQWLIATENPAAFNRADEETQQFLLMCALQFVGDVTTQGRDAGE